MSNEKLFTVAGTATDRGVTKARFANDLVARIKILNKNNCTNINLVELPEPMTKLQALRYLQTLNMFEGDAAEAISSKMSEKARVAKRDEVRFAVNPATISVKSAVTKPETETA